MATKADYRKQIIDKRAAIANEREAKKRDNAKYANIIKSATSPSSKASYRKTKISLAEGHDRRINSLKADIIRLQGYMLRASN
jgi:folate-dependent phosphoribosylglycinamide formyltransferase PurN